MRITFVIQDLYRGGAQYVTAMLARGQSSVGHQVDVVVSAVHGALARDRPDIKPFYLPETVRMIGLPYLRSSFNLLSLRQYFKAWKPEVVLPMSSNYEPSCALACSLLRKRDRPKLIPVIHSGGIGMQVDESRIHAKKKFAEHIHSLLPITMPVDHVIAVSQGVADALIDIGKFAPDQISVIHNPVIDDVFKENISSDAGHPWLADKDLPVIVAAGSHVPLKGYDLLIKAISLVIPQKKCRLIIFGEGPDTEKLKFLAKELGVEDYLSFPGHIDALPAEINQADVFVVSSHCESFSVVLVEALACGVPVVATNCPVGPPEILNNGQYGILVEPNDPKMLAAGILATLNGHAVIPSEESWKPYEIENVVAQYEEVLQRIKNR